MNPKEENTPKQPRINWLDESQRVPVFYFYKGELTKSYRELLFYKDHYGGTY